MEPQAFDELYYINFILKHLGFLMKQA